MSTCNHVDGSRADITTEIGVVDLCRVMVLSSVRPHYFVQFES